MGVLGDIVSGATNIGFGIFDRINQNKRQDTAISRLVSDAQKNGINPLTALGSNAGADSSVVSGMDTSGFSGASSNATSLKNAREDRKLQEEMHNQDVATKYDEMINNLKIANDRLSEEIRHNQTNEVLIAQNNEEIKRNNLEISNLEKSKQEQTKKVEDKRLADERQKHNQDALDGKIDFSVSRSVSASVGGNGSMSAGVGDAEGNNKSGFWSKIFHSIRGSVSSGGNISGSVGTTSRENVKTTVAKLGETDARNKIIAYCNKNDIDLSTDVVGISKDDLMILVKDKNSKTGFSVIGYRNGQYYNEQESYYKAILSYGIDLEINDYTDVPKK